MNNCDICGKNTKDLENVLTSGDIVICKECIETGYQILCNGTTQKTENKKDIITPKNPKEIHKILNNHVIGQEKSKKILSVAIYNHFKKINNNSDIVIDKSNILLIGPSGSGKTMIAKTIAKEFNLPIIIGDATNLTESGYVGGDIENLLTQLYQNANYDLEKAQHGIVFIDEIDKISVASNDSGKTNVGRKGVQQGLLKIIEGTTVEIPVNGKPQAETILLDTTNILFIFSGAFIDLNNIIKKRLGIDNKTLNFVDNNKSEKSKKTLEVIEQFTNEDLIEYGFIQEFLGRISVKTTLKELTKEELKSILIEPKNSIIEQYIEIFKQDNIEIGFSEDLLDKIVNKSLELKTGARGLKTIIEDLMLDPLYNIDEYENHNITFNEKYFESKELKDLEIKIKTKD